MSLRREALLAALLACRATGSLLWPPTARERAGWLSDLDALERQTGAGYANLGDRLRTRRLSPRDLDARARRE